MPYSASFDPFDFSHGEADIHHSDSETVGYGFTNPKAFPDPATFVNGFSGGVNADASAGPTDEVKNATPDVTVNDYGAHWSSGPGNHGPGDQKVMNDSVSGLPMSRTDSPLQHQQAGKVAGGKAAAIAAGSNDILSTYSAVSPSLTAPGPSIASTAAQTEIATSKQYAPQLTTATGAKTLTLSSGNIIMFGAALLLIGLFFHSKG